MVFFFVVKFLWFLTHQPIVTAHGKIDRMKRYIRSIVQRFKSVPLPVRIGAGATLLALLYVGIFVIPTNIHFNYATTTSCVNRLTLLPGLQQQRAGKNDFKVEPQQVTKVFGLPLFSTSVCIAPASAPKEGLKKVSSAPFGIVLFSKTFNIHVPAAPTANVGSLKGKEVSAVKPLTVPLNGQDLVHTYSLHSGEKSTACKAVSQGMSCNMAQLDLEPSSPYELVLYRGYGKDTPQKIETLSIKTLTAVQLVDSTLQSGMTIYDKPAGFRLTFDRALESAEGNMKRTDGTASDIPATFTVEGSIVVVTPKQPLPRNASYQMTLKQVTGKDGGSLSDPIVTPFTVSGGPKVTDVSVGSTSISQNAKIIVTFDQALKADADIAKFAHLNGIEGAVSRASDNSIAVTVSSAPLCTAFSIVVDKGLPSGSNDETSADQWKFDGRIICGSSSTIGYSVRGRAIVAYTFGTGGSTILFTGGIHGSEPSGVSTMQAWVTYLQANGYKIPADKKIVVVPNTNPDGIAAGTRYNANNVNLDRNFPADNWRPDIDTATGMHSTGGGTSAGSEPETQALIKLTQQLRPRLEVSFHAQGRLVGANQFGDSIAIGKMYAGIVGYQTMIGNAEEVMGYSITGEYEDWMGQKLNVPAILIELPSSSGNYLNSQMTALMKLLTV